jgi:PhoH-like ATPase
MKEKRKIFIIDTSVLLYDKNSITAFRGNDVYIPIQVLDELDKKKIAPGLLGESARFVNRFLDDLRGGKTNLTQGVKNEEYDILYKVCFCDENKVKSLIGGFELDLSVNDNKILLSALLVAQDNPGTPVVLVTKDINLRVKSDALGIHGEDYRKDRVDAEFSDSTDCIWSGKSELFVSEESINKIYANGHLNLEEDSIDVEGKLFPNQMVILKSGQSHSAMCKVNRDSTGFDIIKIDNKQKTAGIIPQDKEQAFAMNCLLDREIPLVSITGVPGSGKTFLTLLVGLDQVAAKKYERIVITRSLEPVGREMGFLPGDIDDKMLPWLGPIMDNFRQSDKDLTYFDMMRKKGAIDIAPLSFIRGRSFPKSYIIVDEAQNATIHELKTIITRAGEGSKIILMGDIQQIDTPYIDRLTNGLSVVVDRFKNSPLAAHIHLSNGRRSPLANEANNLL